MIRNRQQGWAFASATALLLVLSLAAPASAKKFQMNGTWLMRKGQAFIPLQFGFNNGGANKTHVSMGSWTEAPFTKGFVPSTDQVVQDTGTVTQTGASPANLKINKHFWQQNQFAVIPLSGANLVQITSMFVIDAPYSTGNFAANGGPGSFTWCPPGFLNGGTACTKNATIPTKNNPGLNAGNRGKQGRVVYTGAGAKYGGVIQIGLSNGGINSVPAPTPSPPFRVGHAIFGGIGTTVRKLAPGGGAKDVPATEFVALARGYITQPPGGKPPPFNLIMTPGPFVTTGGGVTTTMAGAKQVLPSCCTFGGMMTMTGQYTSNWGFPHTTATVLAQVRTGTGGYDFFSVMGSDARTPNGAGNLNTVAGGLADRHQLGAGGAVSTMYAQFDKLFLELGPIVPAPSMSPAGLAATGALMLLAVGYVMRRRLF